MSKSAALPRLVAMLSVLAVVLSVLGACGPGSGPEGVVRAYVDAVNTRDEAKFMSLWTPDRNDYAANRYTLLTQTWDMRFADVRVVSVRDWDERTPTEKIVTVQMNEVWPGGTLPANEGEFLVKQLNGSWYIWVDG
jgi:hypothetical protein